MERLTSMMDVVAYCREHRLPAEVVGRWVWIRFDRKPGPEVRRILKAAGFRWSSKREQWYHTAGCRSYGRGGPDPRTRYGSIPVGEIETSAA